MSDQKLPVDQIWHDWFMTDAYRMEKRLYQSFRFLPHDPRCKICYSPFDGMGGFVMRLLGRKQSSLNPNFCNVCERFAQKHVGGAEVEMSVLFADVRGSTALSEQMKPVEFQKLINRFYIGATHEIAGQDGLVEKLAGDAVAAFWGAGFAGKDYVSRTIRAAQNIARLMQAQDIPVGIGVHAGMAYFGAMGSTEGLVDISAIGEEVNTAARLASKAAAGEILISEAALERAHMDSNGLETRQLALKGISEPVQVRVLTALDL
jgi:adenylate cyclase